MVIVSPPKEGTASKLAYSFGGDHNLLSKWGDARICVAPFVWYQHQAELKSVVQIWAHITNQTIKINQNNYETKNYLQGIFFISLHTPPEKTHTLHKTNSKSP